MAAGAPAGTVYRKQKGRRKEQKNRSEKLRGNLL
jgi:hypothetical protein